MQHSRACHTVLQVKHLPVRLHLHALHFLVLPGASVGMPDLHSGYGFAIGNVAAVDMDDPKSVVSPGGVGFDINCGVRQVGLRIPVATAQGRLAAPQSCCSTCMLGSGIVDSIQCTLPCGCPTKEWFACGDIFLWAC
jgi:hypothetical protein